MSSGVEDLQIHNEHTDTQGAINHLHATNYYIGTYCDCSDPVSEIICVQQDLIAGGLRPTVHLQLGS